MSKVEEVAVLEQIAKAVLADRDAMQAYRWLYNGADVESVRVHYMMRFVEAVLKASTAALEE